MQSSSDTHLQQSTPTLCLTSKPCLKKGLLRPSSSVSHNPRSFLLSLSAMIIWAREPPHDPAICSTGSSEPVREARKRGGKTYARGNEAAAAEKKVTVVRGHTHPYRNMTSSPPP